MSGTDQILIYVKGRAYDPTRFISKHPGGMSSIIRHNGKDVTESYNMHSKNGKSLWERFRVPEKDAPYVARGRKHYGTCCVIS